MNYVFNVTIIFILGYLILVLPISKKIEDFNSRKIIRMISTIGIIILALLISASEAKTPIINCTIFMLILRAIWSASIKKNQNNTITPNVINSSKTTIQIKTENLVCQNCGHVGKPGDKFCTSCGTTLKTETVTMSSNDNKSSYADPLDYEEDMTLTLEGYIQKHVNKELEKAGIDLKSKLIPSQSLKRQNILVAIFSVLLCFYISLIFFHFPTITYIIGLTILVVLFIFTIKFNFKSYIMKQIKARPSEKISNIIMSTKSTLVKNTSRIYLLIGCMIAICIPLVIFKDPKIFYEKMDNGYGVRFYAYGLTNKTTATIPSTYKGKNVVALRGNTFSNMPELTEINLPDTITEIRGQAFAGLEKLEKINLPKNLEYLGGGAFKDCTALKSIVIPSKVKEINGDTFNGAYSLRSVTLPEGLERIGGSAFENCDSLTEVTIPSTVKEIGGSAFKYATSLKEINLPEGLKTIDGGAFANCDSLTKIIIPDSVTTLGGEAFQYDSSLSEVKLSNNLTEIRGNTFEECSSLKTITIPDSVTRIGGHAFYGSGLQSVILTKNSKLNEIGSSAFRSCYSLKSITLPRGVSINERAFKGSPTAISYFN